MSTRDPLEPLRGGTSLLLWDAGKLRLRWFALDEQCNYLFWAEPSAEARGEDSTFALPLADITKVQRAHHRETVFGRDPSRVPPETLALSFALETKAGDVLEVAATTSSEARSWFQGLKWACANARKRCVSGCDKEKEKEKKEKKKKKARELEDRDVLSSSLFLFCFVFFFLLFFFPPLF
jgi:hypothetical protein